MKTNKLLIRNVFLNKIFYSPERTCFVFFTSHHQAHAKNVFETISIYISSRSQWPRGLRRRSTAARLLRSCVLIPPEAWTSVCCECCVLSGRGLCDGLITRPEESYRLWCVVVCDIETSSMRSQTSIVIELKIGDTSLDVSPLSH